MIRKKGYLIRKYINAIGVSIIKLGVVKVKRFWMTINFVCMIALIIVSSKLYSNITLDVLTSMNRYDIIVISSIIGMIVSGIMVAIYD